MLQINTKHHICDGCTSKLTLATKVIAYKSCGELSLFYNAQNTHCFSKWWWKLQNIHELSIVKPAKTSSQILNVLITCFHKSCVQIFFLIFFLLSNQVEFYDRDENRKKCHYFVKLIIFLFLQIPIIFSSLNYNCSNLLGIRNLLEAFCYQKLFWPFTVIYYFGVLKTFANSQPSASNF